MSVWCESSACLESEKESEAEKETERQSQRRDTKWETRTERDADGEGQRTCDTCEARASSERRRSEEAEVRESPAGGKRCGASFVRVEVKQRREGVF